MKQPYLLTIRKIDHWILMGIGILLAGWLRYYLLDFESGDYKCCLSPWFDFIVSHEGFKALRHNFSNYTPLYLYLLTFSTVSPLPKLYSIKLISICFDFCAAFFVFQMVKEKYHREYIPALSFLAVLFAPTILLNGVFWAQSDVIYTTGLLASIYFLTKHKNGLAFLSYSVAFSFKMQALFLFPLLFILFLKRDVSIKYFGLIPVVYFLSILPCFLLGRPLMDLLSIYINQGETYQVLAANAPNPYQWFPNEYYPVFKDAGAVFATAVVATFCFLVYKSETKIDSGFIIKLSLVSVLIVPFFLPKMHERYFFPADLISILYAFYFPRYFYVPLAIGLISFFSYLPFLFGRPFIPLGYLAIGLGIVILITMKDLIQCLYLHNERRSNG